MQRKSHNHPSPPAVTRRHFLTTGLAGVSAATLGWELPHPLGTARAASANIQNIDPGYVGPQYYDGREEEALLQVLESGSPFRYWGPGQPHHVQDFEDHFARHMGTRFALGVTSGTAALDCAVTGLGVGPGDEVVVPAYTWWSDYTCVVHAGALPVFADIDRTLNIDPADLERRITPRTKAVIAVHLLGGPCHMEPILEIARKHRIAVLEDCAQCVGGSYRGQKLGAIGDVGIYSFQLNKMITSGEGGALVTNNPVIYERAARFHDMGTIRSPFTDRIGGSHVDTFAGENFRMSEFTGAVLGAQLPKLDAMVRSMRQNAAAIREGIQDLAGMRLRERPDPEGDIGYGVYFELSNKRTRDRCIAALRQRGVPAATLTGSVLLPVQESVVHKRTRHPDWPSFHTPHGKAIRYGPNACPQTLQIFDRFVQIRVGAKYTEEVNRYITKAIREVYLSLS